MAPHLFHKQECLWRARLELERRPRAAHARVLGPHIFPADTLARSVAGACASISAHPSLPLLHFVASLDWRCRPPSAVTLVALVDARWCAQGVGYQGQEALESMCAGVNLGARSCTAAASPFSLAQYKLLLRPLGAKIATSIAWRKGGVFDIHPPPLLRGDPAIVRAATFPGETKG